MSQNPSAAPEPGDAWTAPESPETGAGAAPVDGPEVEEVDAYVIPAGTVVVTQSSLLARVGAEAFGTFFLVLAGVGTALWASLQGVGAGVLGVALAFGIAVIAAASAVGHVSGGHFNPAVTLGAVLAGRTSAKDLLPYWLAQVVGAAAAAAVLFVSASSLSALSGNERAFFSSVSNGFADHSPIAQQAPGGFTWVAAGLLELVVTAVFVAVILGVTDRRVTKVQAPVVIGLTLTAGLLVTIPLTNGSLNPARSLATAIFSDSWAFEQLWLFAVAPLLGAAVAALLYRAFAAAPPEDNLLEEDDEFVTDEDVVVVEERRD